MSIRPRLSGVYHDYTHVFSDLRSGRITYGDFQTMLDEDLVEGNRRRAVVKYPDKIKGLCAPATDPFLKRED